MPDVIITPLMSLPNPVPGADTGPDYATNLQTSLNILDGHNHSSGSGAPITPGGILINADLSFNGANATGLKSARYSAQSAPLAGASDLGCSYVSGVDLWFNDVNGNQVQLTSGGLVNATSSGISSGTASAAFSGGVLIVNSNTNTPANIKCGSVLIGEPAVSPNFITVQSPTSLAASYPFVLPTALPASQKFMTLDASGNLAAPWAVDNSTLQIASSTTLQVKDSGIVTAKIADSNVTTAKIADSAVTTAKLNNASVTEAKLATANKVTTTAVGVTLSGATSSAWITSPSISVTGSRPVIITLSGTGGLANTAFFKFATTGGSAAAGYAELNRGGSTYLTAPQYGGPVSGGIDLYFGLVLSYIDFPAAGTYTYAVILHNIFASTTMSGSDVRITVLEF
jgi:hypothetical protein